MRGEREVRCEVPYFPAAAIGLGTVWLAGVVAALVYGDPRVLAVMGGLLALTVGAGALRGRYVVRAVAFTAAEVRLESRARVRTVPVTALTRVSVGHAGDTLDGYRETSVRLEWPGGARDLTCDHDPGLAEALRRLRVPVEERWEELREPSTG